MNNYDQTALNQEKLILASQSPRRKELLEQAGILFDVKVSGVDESKIAFSRPDQYVAELASLKARDISVINTDAWVLGADTIVVLDNRILEKPADRNEAVGMLTELSGREHIVYTAFCLCHKQQNRVVEKTVETQVRFRDLTRREIDWYADTGEPFDKAGGYGIQGKGAFLVRSISGSYTNVVGLPVCEVIEELTRIKLIYS